MGFATNQARRRAIVCERAEKIDGGFSRIDHQRRAVFQMGPARAGGESEVGQRSLRMPGQPRPVLIRQVHQCGGRARRERHDAEPCIDGVLDRGLGGSGLRGFFGCFLEEDVSVGAGEAE